jgi:hypothetical protein
LARTLFLLASLKPEGNDGHNNAQHHDGRLVEDTEELTNGAHTFSIGTLLIRATGVVPRREP